jgi:hypothetical protein
MPLTMITASQAGTRVANSAAFKNAVEFLDARIKANADLGLTTYTYDKQAHQLSSEKITQLKAFLVENGYTLSEPSNSVILITWSNG